MSGMPPGTNSMAGSTPSGPPLVSMGGGMGQAMATMMGAPPPGPPPPPPPQQPPGSSQVMQQQHSDFPPQSMY